MNQENTEKLIKAGPHLFGTYEQEKSYLTGTHQGEYRPFHPIAFGVECGDGWFNILLELVTRIELLIQRLPEAEQKHYYLNQVKEKFGTLRFYMSCETEGMSELISVAEEKSGVTCEQCGAPGKLNTNGWWVTTCESHTKK